LLIYKHVIYCFIVTITKKALQYTTMENPGVKISNFVIICHNYKYSVVDRLGINICTIKSIIIFICIDHMIYYTNLAFKKYWKLILSKMQVAVLFLTGP